MSRVVARITGIVALACALLLVVPSSRAQRAIHREVGRPPSPQENAVHMGLNRGPGRSIVRALQARRDVRLRTGESVRPRLCVECEDRRSRLTLELPGLRRDAAQGPAPFAARLTIHEGTIDTLSVRAVEDVEWLPDSLAGVWSIPDSSEWTGHLTGAFGVSLVSQKGGPVRDRIDFRLSPFFTDRDSIREACVPLSVEAPSVAGSGDSVLVEEFPEVIFKVSPEYPEQARQGRLQGTVVVNALVDREGRVARCYARMSLPGLDDAAIESVRQYRFRPATSGGKPVAVWVAVPIRFVLK